MLVKYLPKNIFLFFFNFQCFLRLVHAKLVLQGKQSSYTLEKKVTVMSELKVTGATVKKFEKLSELNAQINKLTAEKESLRKELLVIMGDNLVATFRSHAIARIKLIEQNRVDSKLLESKYPKVFADVAKPSVSQRLTVL